MIRLWHGMGMKGEMEESMWKIYYTQSPEMKRISNLLNDKKP